MFYNFQPLRYDYYGYYNYPANENNVYKQKLEQDYTFGFPAHHDMVSKLHSLPSALFAFVGWIIQGFMT